MRSLRLIVSLLAVTIGIITLLYASLSYFYHDERHSNVTIKASTARPKRVFDRPMRHIPLNEVYKDSPKMLQDLSIEFEENRQAHMIETPGCHIPISIINYKKSAKLEKKSCGERAVYLRRRSDDKIQITIKDKVVRRLTKKSSIYHCCYMFFRTSGLSLGTVRIRNTACKIIKDGYTFRIEGDFINVKCYESQKTNKSRVIYEDIFPFCKKIKNIKTTKCRDKQNVLMIGMDSMSLSRFVQTMTRTAAFFKDNFWLTYRGYHKIGDNTFPNLMAVLTGLDLKTISERCSNKIDSCNDFFIWSKFKKAGYVTAYGEDYLRLPDTFSRDYTFSKKPTHHYMKPFYLKGEREINNKSLLCAGKISSGQQLLDYAYDFAFTYRKQSFFGFFWMNSYSHNINNRPEDADIMFENFFNRLTYTGILKNTFVIFLSDHGVRFGEDRLKVESYYDDRLPSLFMWVPAQFKWKYPKKLKSLMINQFKLVTPYDLYETLHELNEMSLCNTTDFLSDYNRQSLFDIVSGNRTCQEAGISDKWCSCHKLYPLDHQDLEGLKSVYFVANHIRNEIKNIKTKSCTKCASLSLRNVTRIHFYYDNDKTNLYYVVAFSMSPENVFYEATVLKHHSQLSLVGSVSIISPYKGFGACTVNPRSRVFCVCQKINNCEAL